MAFGLRMLLAQGWRQSHHPHHHRCGWGCVVRDGMWSGVALCNPLAEYIMIPTFVYTYATRSREHKFHHTIDDKRDLYVFRIYNCRAACWHVGRCGVGSRTRGWMLRRPRFIGIGTGGLNHFLVMIMMTTTMMLMVSSGCVVGDSALIAYH